MDKPAWFDAAIALGGVLGTAVTAIATIFLWRVTQVLARETRRMVDAASQPHVVATIDPNQWSIRHADLKVDNTGNATAYDIQIAFAPPIEQGPDEPGVPLQQVSVLKPGQGVSSYLSEFEPLLGRTFTITVSWRRDPSKPEREVNSYSLDLRYLENISTLGSSSPLIQIAEQVQKIQENWASVARGHQKIRADIFTSGDRLHERRQRERERRQRQRDSQT